MNPMIGIGGAPTRETTTPDDPAERKKYPVASGVLDYFPDALVEISRVSWEGNEQHNPGQPLHWARNKSADEADAMMRHFMRRGTRDKDGRRHTAKAAWRLLALLQKEVEDDAKGVEDEYPAVCQGDPDPEPDAAFVDALREIDDESVGGSDDALHFVGRGYERNGKSACNATSRVGYYCTLPVGHGGRHCATDTFWLDAAREWE